MSNHVHVPRVTPAGLLFGPNGNGKQYLSLNCHRGAGDPRYKSFWSPAIPPPVEYDVFCMADNYNWSDQHGHYWAVHDGGNTELGTRGERLAKFPYNANPRDPWHGFPVSPLERGDADAPPDDFVANWIEAGVISKTVGRRIQRRRI